MTEENQTDSLRPTGTDFRHFGCGLLMGGADIIPGVSGGTVALILGIYERLVTAISRCDRTFFGHLFAFRIREAAEHLDLRFIIPLAVGIACGIAVLGSVMHVLLEHRMAHTFAAFFGLIAASCYLVARMVERWTIKELIALIIGATFAVWLVSQHALKDPPNELWYVFLCGCVSICAMILPGISGAFILLILGMYHDITGIIKETLKLHITGEALLTIAVFASGCLVGLISFSKFLRWLLQHHASTTMAVLCGFMAGSLCKLWPFQIDITPPSDEVIEFKHRTFKMVPWNDVEWTSPTTISIIATALIAAALVIILDRVSGGMNTAVSDETLETT